MKQVLVKHGEIVIADVPIPAPAHGTVLVQVHYSLISTGTEVGIVKSSSASIAQRILSKPELIKRGLDLIKERGVTEAIRAATGSMTIGQPLGYSAAGQVIEVGEGVDDLRIGDLVACAGAGIANHAEWIAVPRNLTVRTPDSVTTRQAASVTLGAIAMQGIRQAEPKLGEIIVVSGLGLLGLLTVQLLKANGCRVIGLELDPNRMLLAKTLGVDEVLSADEENLTEKLLSLSHGYGVDATIITAATDSDTPLNQAMHHTRRKGKVIIVGAVGLNLNRSPFYEKEIDLRISCSYGPGRYDPTYEQYGLDYPYAYVRWTENRNMQAYLEVVASGKISLDHLIQREFPVEQAADAYRALKNEAEKPLGIMLTYRLQGDLSRSRRINTAPSPTAPRPGIVSVGLVGAGGFASNSILPNIQSLTGVCRLHAVASNNGLKAKEAATRFGATYATSDVDDVLRDPDVNAVIIATRHDSHVSLAIRALDSGKAVFLEKPMALDESGLRDLEGAIDRSSVPFTVGFNRRFAPLMKPILEITRKRTGPMIVNYQMNAGFIPYDHWTQTPAGGGRNIGEACHVYDLFTCLTESTVRTISAGTIGGTSGRYKPCDNFTATITFADGSVCILTYTAMGSKSYPKELMTIYCDGQVLSLTDYRELTVAGRTVKSERLSRQDKGHVALLREFAQGIRDGNRFVIPLAQLVQATEISLAVEQQLSR